MLIWKISGGLRLSQNFVKIENFHDRGTEAKFQILTTFSRLSIQTCESFASLKNGILECSYVDLKDFWKFEVESKFCQKIENFHDRGPERNFRFWPPFQDFHFRSCESIASLKMAF